MGSFVRKQDHRAIIDIQLNHKQNAKHIKTLHKDTDIMWFTQMMGYIHKEIAIPFIIVRKMKGYNL